MEFIFMLTHHDATVSNALEVYDEIRDLPLLYGTGLRYCPFPGRIVGHPSILEGTIPEIADSAAALTSRPEVAGLDLLAYRYAGDVEALVAAVLQGVDKPVIAAGSVDSVER